MKKLLTLIIISSLIITSCKKPAGEGGKATIKGKVFVQNYNGNFTQLNDEYYAQGERVYIIYGDETSVGDDVRTSYDGSYEFKYLRKGNYKIYAFSKDSTLSSLNKKVEVLKNVEIKSKKETVELPTIVIFN